MAIFRSPYHSMRESHQDNSKPRPYRARFHLPRANRTSVQRIRPLETRTHTYRVPQVHRKPSDTSLPVLRRPHQVSYIQSHGICLHTTWRARIAPPSQSKILGVYSLFCPLSLKTNSDVLSSIHAHYASLLTSSPALCCLFPLIFFSASLLSLSFDLIYIFIRGTEPP